MLNKKVVVISIIIISLFTLSTVFAQDNVTCDNDVVAVDDDDDDDVVVEDEDRLGGEDDVVDVDD